MLRYGSAPRPFRSSDSREATAIKLLRRFALVVSALLVVVLAGPRARVTDGWVEPELGADVDGYLEGAEAGVARLRHGEQRAIVWADSTSRARTALSVVYLHGFSADRHEVEPLVSDLADSLGANAYFARLRGHGRDGSAMAEASAEDWLHDTAEAVAVGHRIGERIVLVGTSTGGTLALWAARRPEIERRVAAVVLISPNLGLRDRTARVLLWPWGGLVARLLVGAERCFDPVSPEQARHWTTCYPTSALLPMTALAELVRTSQPAAPRVPTLVFYAPDDEVVDAAVTERALRPLEAGGRVTLVQVDHADDPAAHVLAGDILSPSSTEFVTRRVLAFLRSALGAEGSQTRAP